jgi:hypothetical protein
MASASVHLSRGAWEESPHTCHLERIETRGE